MAFMRRIINTISLFIICFLLLVLQGCYTLRPIAGSASSPDYNKRINVSNARYKKKGNGFDIAFNVGMIGAGAVGGYNLNLIQQQTENGKEPVKIANAAIGALAGATIGYLIDQAAGKNKTHPISNPNDWIRKANDNYRFLSGTNEKFIMIHSSAESDYKARNLSDVQDFKTAFPNSSNTEQVAQQILSSTNLSDIAGLPGIYPQYSDKSKERYLSLSLSQSSTFDLFKEKITRYPESLANVGLNINYQNEGQLKTLFSQFDAHVTKIGTGKVRKYKNDILDNLSVISTNIDSEYEKIQYEKISSSTSPQPYRDYIKKFPNSQYTVNVKTKLNKMDNDSFAKASKGNTKQEFENYASLFPSGNNINEANRRIGNMNRIEEEQRIQKEREESARASAERQRQEEAKRREQAQRYANFMQLEGKRVVWYVNFKAKTDSFGDSFFGIIGDAIVGDLNYTNYKLKYTGVVEKIIGEESAKIVVSKIEIVDPGWASVNYVKFRSTVLQMANQGKIDGEVALGSSVVKEYYEIEF